MINGYKCFKKGLINSYGVSFQVGETYRSTGKIVFGVDGNGFHMCERLEDTLRFFDTFQEDVDICSVVGFGNYIKRSDKYNDYYDMYVVENIRIVRKLTREEIVLYGLNLPEMRLIRFLSLFKLDDIEKKLFLEKFNGDRLVNEYIDYYQNNKKDAFEKKLIK